MRKIKWTLDACKKDAKKYKTKTEWRRAKNSGYQMAHRNGWTSKLCKHMVPTSEILTKWTLEFCIEDAKKYKTKVEWMKNSRAAKTASNRGWMEKCSQHMKPAQNIWSLDDCITDAKKYKTRKEWARNSGSAYNKALSKKWIKKCCAHMPNPVRWTLEDCIKDAKKHKTKSSWVKSSGGIYQKAWLNGWVGDCCVHMVKKRKWTLKECIKDAKKYKTRSAWNKAKKSGYDSALKNGWLDQCCFHMPEYANQDRKEYTKSRPQYLSFFKKHKISFKEQFKLGSKKIDFVFFINNKNYGLEIKHDDNNYSYLKDQIKSYRQLGNLSQYNLKKVILSSPKGRHGISIKELESLIKSLK